jgi:dinuclear metal center YbgI/SA1388 family protein
VNSFTTNPHSGKLIAYIVILEFAMITLQEICRYLDELLAVPMIADGCPNGLQVEGRAQVRTMATAVTASVKTIEMAVAKGVDLLLVHHGLFWNKDSYVIRGVKRRKLQLLLDSEMSLLAYHLPLDAHAVVGNNWRAATEMGWTDLMPFCAINGVPIGVRGKVEPMPRQAFQLQLEHYYNHPAHVALGGKETVENVALISGGAHRYLPEAVASGVDAFVTGSYDEPVWHQAFEEGINFFALGHAATETIGPKAIGQQLRTAFHIPCQFLDEPNPF